MSEFPLKGWRPPNEDKIKRKREDQCQCAICERSRRWEAEEDKTKLFDEMCAIVTNAEFEESMMNAEGNTLREFLSERNLMMDYVKWRRER